MAVSTQFTNVFQGFGNNYELLAGGKVYVTDRDTGDPITTWSDFAKTIPNVYPVILSASGKAVIILDDGPVNIRLDNSADATIWTLNNYDVSTDTINEPVLQDYFLSVQQACLTSELNAAASADSVGDEAADAAASAAAALVSENNAAADLVLTNADVVSTNADVVSTGLDVIATNADVVTTNSDAVQTALDVIATAASATASASSANNLGAWSGLTGSYSPPFAVNHDNKVWSGNNTIADITLSEPAIGNSDYTLVSSAQTSKETSSVIDIVLTSASENIQAIAMTAPAKAVLLPDATTISGGNSFIIKNTGTIPFAIRDSGETDLAYLDPEQIAIFYLTNNGTAAGVWAVGNQSMFSFLEELFTYSVTTVNAVSSSNVSVAALSATQAIVAYKGAAGYVQACTLNIAGVIITQGAILNVNAQDSYNVSVTKLSATQAVVAFVGGPVTIIAQTCTLNISGTDVTEGAVLEINAVASAYTSVAALSATQAIVTYKGVSNYLETCTLNISGTDVTRGAILPVNALLSDFSAVAKLSATQAIVVYKGTSGYLQTCTLNVSVETVTKGTIVTVNAVTSNYISIASFSSTQAIVAYIGTSTFVEVCTLNVTGTDVGVGKIKPVNAVAGSAYTSITMQSATSAIVAYSGTSGYLEQNALKIDETDVEVGERVKGNAVVTTWVSVSTLSTTRTIASYKGTSGYLETNLIGKTS
jgi:hypothetical protein